MLVFVDGLRCDLGLELGRLLKEQGFAVEVATRWSALPTVTATAKPAWRPLADGLSGNRLTEGFEPQIAETGKDLKTQAFRKAMSALNVEYDSRIQGRRTSQPVECCSVPSARANGASRGNFRGTLWRPHGSAASSL